VWGQIIRDAVFVVAGVADFAEEALACLVVSLGFEDSGEVELGSRRRGASSATAWA